MGVAWPSRGGLGPRASRGRAPTHPRRCRAGVWHRHEPDPVEAPPEVPTFHEFASEWFERHRPEWRENTAGDYKWSLSYHLLPFFRDHLLTQITPEEVDRYKAKKLREGKLSP